MATVTPDTEATQGNASYLVLLNANEVITFQFGTSPNVLDWSQGPISWVVHPPSGGNISIEYSLVRDGDYWSPVPDGPYNEKHQGVELARFERIRFTATMDGSYIELLSALTMDWSTA